MLTDLYLVDIFRYKKNLNLKSRPAVLCTSLMCTFQVDLV